jgi:hypothetical protein
MDLWAENSFRALAWWRLNKLKSRDNQYEMFLFNSRVWIDLGVHQGQNKQHGTRNALRGQQPRQVDSN